VLSRTGRAPVRPDKVAQAVDRLQDAIDALEQAVRE
jgi:hypothetical protein